MGREHGRAQSSLPRCHLAAPEAVLAAAGSARLRPSRVWVAVEAENELIPAGVERGGPRKFAEFKNGT